MKRSSDLFSRLPSVNDLLENPRIKGLLGRVQEMEVTSGVRQFVERMRGELSRRSADAPIPSISELADRAARFILGRHSDQRTQAINATGQLWPAGLSGPPLADEALAALTAARRHYHRASGEMAAELAAELAGGQAAAVLASPPAAMMLAMATLADGQPIVVARGELGTLDGVARLTDLARQAEAELLEIGATDAVSLDDYRQALESGARVVLRIESLPYALEGQTCRPELAELVKLAHQHSAVVVHNVGRGPVAALAESIPLKVATAADSLAAGVDLVVARGDGYTGGPAGGLAIGRREVVGKLTSSPLYAAGGVNELTDIALHATLALHRTPEQAALAIPTLAALSTPILNLQTRAERLAAQIAEQPGLVSAIAVDIPAGNDLGSTRPLPSFGVSVICETEQRDRVQRQLEDARPQVIGIWSGDRVLLDLRTVAPEEDIALVAAFEMPESDEPDVPESDVLED